MVYTATVENGTANLSIDTTGLGSGKYRIITEYTQNDTYDTSTQQSYLTLEPVVWTEIGVGTNTPWTSSMMRGGVISNG